MVRAIDEDKSAQAKPALPYEVNSGITRRAFRILLVLTFVNTILLGINLMGPQTYPQMMKIWNDWQAKWKKEANDAKLRAKQRTLLAASRSFEFPKGYIAYTEDQAKAKSLILSGQRYRPAKVSNLSALPGWQAPAIAFRSTPRNEVGAVYLHERKLPDGTPVLVAVNVDSETRFDTEGTLRSTVLTSMHRAHKERTLVARVTAIDGGAILHTYEMELVLPDTDADSIVATTTSPMSNQRSRALVGEINPGNVLEFDGGGSDPSDPTHFTIPFTIDGKPCLIDGKLADDAFRLTPRAGHALPTIGQPRWYLPAGADLPPMATTRPPANPKS